MLHTRKSFSVPATTPTKTLCAIHHFDNKGKCLRCPEKIVTTVKADDLRSLAKRVESQYKRETVPTDSEGVE